VGLRPHSVCSLDYLTSWPHYRYFPQGRHNVHSTVTESVQQLTVALSVHPLGAMGAVTHSDYVSQYPRIILDHRSTDRLYMVMFCSRGAIT